MSEAGLIRLCAVGEVAEDEPVQVEAEGMVYAVFLLDGAHYVTADECTHGPGWLSEGWIEGREIVCPFHQGKFDLTTGEPTAAPCADPLRTWTAYVRDDAVWIDPAERRALCPARF
jgi:nitrite reductase/ring-hydroxylating ferredoxin subunit